LLIETQKETVIRSLFSLKIIIFIYVSGCIVLEELSCHNNLITDTKLFRMLPVVYLNILNLNSVSASRT
jgi:hypothetical protein